MAFQGPFDQNPFPNHLTARAVTPDPAPLLEGYSLLTDLAQNKSFTETLWLSLKGELPDKNQLWLLEQALYFLAPVHMGEAPTHASMVSRVTESWTSSTLVIGTLGLAERSRALQIELLEWTTFLKTGAQGQAPLCALLPEKNPELSVATELLFSEFKNRFSRNLGPNLSLRREAVAFLLLNEIDLLEPLMIDFLSIWAAMPLVMAELKYSSHYNVKSYPARLPEIQYVEETNSN